MYPRLRVYHKGLGTIMSKILIIYKDNPDNRVRAGLPAMVEILGGFVRSDVVRTHGRSLEVEWFETDNALYSREGTQSDFVQGAHLIK